MNLAKTICRSDQVKDLEVGQPGLSKWVLHSGRGGRQTGASCRGRGRMKMEQRGRLATLPLRTE